MYISKYFFLVIVAVLISTGSCIKCYNCFSGHNSGCAKLSDSSIKPTECNAELIKNMSSRMMEQAKIFGGAFGFDIDTSRQPEFGPSFVCQKVVTVADGKELVTRSCQINTSDDLNLCKKLESTPGSKTQHCSYCEEDGCNAAPWMTPLGTALLVPALAAALCPLLF